ncbi:uncharacterized protein LOC117902922 [Drosophila subobscura]|uniref:uncharacterized protein LOC117902922 n=1 Tax=Drosophila subobscura TaxID=7241 RepID=UPI00155B31B0|nr:uncharacterized protein LOC117902922 [Drosophila subobscura]
MPGFKIKRESYFGAKNVCRMAEDVYHLHLCFTSKKMENIKYMSLQYANEVSLSAELRSNEYIGSLESAKNVCRMAEDVYHLHLCFTSKKMQNIKYMSLQYANEVSLSAELRSNEYIGSLESAKKVCRMAEDVYHLHLCFTSKKMENIKYMSLQYANEVSLSAELRSNEYIGSLESAKKVCRMAEDVYHLHLCFTSKKMENIKYMSLQYANEVSLSAELRSNEYIGSLESYMYYAWIQKITRVLFRVAPKKCVAWLKTFIIYIYVLLPTTCIMPGFKIKRESYFGAKKVCRMAEDVYHLHLCFTSKKMENIKYMSLQYANEVSLSAELRSNEYIGSLESAKKVCRMAEDVYHLHLCFTSKKMENIKYMSLQYANEVSLSAELRSNEYIGSLESAKKVCRMAEDVYHLHLCFTSKKMENIKYMSLQYANEVSLSAELRSNEYIGSLESAKKVCRMAEDVYHLHLCFTSKKMENIKYMSLQYANEVSLSAELRSNEYIGSLERTRNTLAVGRTTPLQQVAQTFKKKKYLGYKLKKILKFKKNLNYVGI